MDIITTVQSGLPTTTYDLLLYLLLYYADVASGVFSLEKDSTSLY